VLARCPDVRRPTHHGGELWNGEVEAQVGIGRSGADIFDNRHVLPLLIDLAPDELKALQQDNRKFVRTTVREGTNVWKEVGIHVKGAAGSTRDLNDKPALTLAFAKFTPGQRFHGLRKIHLNNSVQDGSYLTENICSELFRKAGVPTPRVSYATLELNGKKKGLYVLSVASVKVREDGDRRQVDWGHEIDHGHG